MVLLIIVISNFRQPVKHFHQLFPFSRSHRYFAFVLQNNMLPIRFFKALNVPHIDEVGFVHPVEPGILQ